MAFSTLSTALRFDITHLGGIMHHYKQRDLAQRAPGGLGAVAAQPHGLISDYTANRKYLKGIFPARL
jgi:hypothetical protein